MSDPKRDEAPRKPKTSLWHRLVAATLTDAETYYGRDRDLPTGHAVVFVLLLLTLALIGVASSG